MSIKEREIVYRVSSVTFNILLFIAIVFIVIYLVAPFFGGKLSIDAIIKYASWACIALAMKYVLKRSKIGLPIRVREYLLLCILLIINFIVWFKYPINLILVLFGVIGFVISYRAQNIR